jgi:hypothetical protein
MSAMALWAFDEISRAEMRSSIDGFPKGGPSFK